MRYLVISLVLVLAAINGHGSANTLEQMLADEALTEAELYAWLQLEGVQDETVSNREIHQLIVDGLDHDDPEIRFCALQAIQWHVGSNINRIIEGQTVSLDRRFQDIPNLYDTLMNMWNTELLKAGGVVPAIEVKRITLEQLELGYPCSGGTPGWVGLPDILAYLYPRDEKVYDMIWLALRDRKILIPNVKADNPIPLLRALYVGDFNNPKDEAFRIQVLTNPQSGYYDTALAAYSLAKFPSPKSLAALTATLEKNEKVRGLPHLDLVEAIMAYGEQATVENYALLRKSMPKDLNTPSRNEKTRAFWIEKELSRLESKVENPTSPADN